jgi:peptidyl-prolyl cis-trans isomerase-like 2
LTRYADPFQDYKQRLARKLQAKAQDSSSSTLASTIPLSSASASASGIGAPPKKRDDVNWFGVKLGEEKKNTSTSVASDEVGVGKYLKLSSAVGAKRSAEPGGTEELKKKRKLGFGNFEAW